MSTYTPVATQTVGTATSTITFSSLPQNYTDLIVVGNPSVSASLDYKWYVNGDNTSGLYSSTRITGNGSSASATSVSNANFNYLNANTPASGTYQTFIMNFQNYTSSTIYKTVLVRYNEAGSETNARVAVWRNTNPITSITISTDSSTFASGSTFTIYGVAAGNSSAKATGGNIVTTDGSYWYHAFTSSGIFVPSQALTVDYLVVAGGGGGGSLSNGGGGGAGGLRSTVTATGGGGSLESALSLSANTVYQAIVGAGGAVNTNGYNSTFSTITSIGGGKGEKSGGSGGGAGNGGSGGGAEYNSSLKGLGTANQGYNGGTSSALSGVYGAAGGGGAGQVGQNGTTSVGGNGGNGVQITALATATGTGANSGYYAGGGGGSADGGTQSTGGLGGGGAGTSAGTNGASGLPNTGGAGGGDRNSVGLNGGSGIIILRYAV